MNKDHCYKIGYIAKPHGLKGEVTVIFTEAVELVLETPIFIDINNNLVPYFIKSYSDRGDKAFVKLVDIDTIEQAAALKGGSIYLSKSERPKLRRGEFYDDEVIGFEVTDQTLGILGEVVEVSDSGLNKLLVVHYQGKEVLIPLNGPFIQSVNKSKKKMIVDLPEGFVEL